MNPDRADVIIPATDIYIKVMEWARAQSILVPEVGLKDGVMLYLYEQHLGKPSLLSDLPRFPLSIVLFPLLRSSVFQSMRYANETLSFALEEDPENMY